MRRSQVVLLHRRGPASDGVRDVLRFWSATGRANLSYVHFHIWCPPSYPPTQPVIPKVWAVDGNYLGQYVGGFAPGDTIRGALVWSSLADSIGGHPSGAFTAVVMAPDTLAGEATLTIGSPCGAQTARVPFVLVRVP